MIKNSNKNNDKHLNAPHFSRVPLLLQEIIKVVEYVISYGLPLIGTIIYYIDLIITAVYGLIQHYSNVGQNCTGTNDEAHLFLVPYGFSNKDSKIFILQRPKVC